MRTTFITLIVAAGFAFGCSKNAAPGPEAAAAASGGESKAPAVSKDDNAMIAASLADLNMKVQQQQYEAAVGALVGMSQMPKSDAQEAQFRARLRETELALLKKAQAGDPAAQQSAQMLGRMMTGR